MASANGVSRGHGTDLTKAWPPPARYDPEIISPDPPAAPFTRERHTGEYPLVFAEFGDDVQDGNINGLITPLDDGIPDVHGVMAYMPYLSDEIREFVGDQGELIFSVDCTPADEEMYTTDEYGFRQRTHRYQDSEYAVDIYCANQPITPDQLVHETVHITVSGSNFDITRDGAFIGLLHGGKGSLRVYDTALPANLGKLEQFRVYKYGARTSDALYVVAHMASDAHNKLQMTVFAELPRSAIEYVVNCGYIITKLGIAKTRFVTESKHCIGQIII